MSKSDLYKDQIFKELEQAEAARKEGNEGKTRVCARRAVGAAVLWYVLSHDRPLRARDTMELLRRAQEIPTFSPEMKQAAVRLSAKITPDFQYSSATDPLVDAHLIIDFVLKEKA